jgi:hypothetical protein
VIDLPSSDQDVAEELSPADRRAAAAIAKAAEDSQPADPGPDA